MGEEISNTVNLDLNLSPGPEVNLEPATSNAAASLFDLANGPFHISSQALRRYMRRDRSRFRQINALPVPAETHSQLMITSANGAALPAGQGSLAGGDSKKCENGNKVMEEDNVTEEKRVVEKSVGSDGSFYDCSICLDLSKEPVLTNCGHLYCWSCLYQWLQVSDANECPVCKGEVSLKTLTPIYGRGKKNQRESQSVTNKIPSRPKARRVESLRTTLERSGYTATDMFRRVYGLERESSTGERLTRPFLNRFMTSRGVRAEQNQSSATAVEPLDDISDTDLVSSIAPDLASPHAMSFRRQMQAQRASRVSFSPVLTPDETLMDAYLMTHPFDEQNNIPGVVYEDRDSLSSIIGVMNSESPPEIDSMVSVSTLSVRRPHENGSRVSDVDSADSRPLRRRRFT